MTKRILRQEVMPLSVWIGLAAIREEATEKVMKKLPGVELVDVEIKKISISNATTVKDMEELEIFLNIDLSFTLENVTPTQISKLLHMGNVILRSDDSTLTVEFLTSYGFEFDDEKEGFYEGSFSHPEEDN